MFKNHQWRHTNKDKGTEALFKSSKYVIEIIIWGTLCSIVIIVKVSLDYVGSPSQ